MIIEIDLVSKDDVFEKYDKKCISKDLINYIVSKAFEIKYNDKIKVVINNNLGESYSSLIKNSLVDEYNKSLLEHNKSNRIQVIYFFVGMIALFVSTLIKGTIFQEIVLIGGWVLIWEMMELVLFSDAKGKKKRIVLKKIINSEIIENMVDII